MILSYCDISVTPAFQSLVTELNSVLGDKAEREAYRDYMEYNGLLRSAEEIIAKKQNDYFSTIPKPVATIVGGSANEIKMSKKDMFKELGYTSSLKSTLSDNNIRILRERISKANNQFTREGISKVYRIENIKQIGQSDNFTYDIKVYKGKLDVVNKADRLSMDDLLNNRVPRSITQGTNQLLKDLQNNVKNVLLGTGGSNANKDNTTGDVRGSNKILGKSIGDKLSDVNYFPLGKLRIDGENVFLENKQSAIDLDTFKRISGKNFSEILNSNEFSSGEKRLYIASRLYQSLYENSLNSAIRQKLFSGTQKSGEEPNVSLISDSSNSAIAFVQRGKIYINLARLLDEFLTAKANGVNLDDYVDMIMFEELIHVVSSEKIDYEVYRKALLELLKNPEIISKSSDFYRLKLNSIDINTISGPDLIFISQELLRQLVQKEILGITTEDIRIGENSILWDFLKQIWDFLRDVFKNNNLINNKKIVNQITDYIKKSESDFLDIGNVTNYSQEVIRKMADALQMQVGVDYSFISPQEAKEITSKSKNPWSGQKSFFFQGKIYFIEGELTPSDVLHEFVHPIIKSLSKQNRTVFDAIWNKLLLTEEGKFLIEEVQKLYPDFDVNSDEFKEEVLVRSIEKIRDLNNKGLEVPSQFQKFIDNLLYSIKQFLRKVFGSKIKISDLDQNTTLEQLSAMLEEGGVFELDQEVITDKDIVAYKNAYNAVVDRLTAEKADKIELQKLTDKYFDVISKYLKNAKQQKNLGELSDVLYNEFGTGQLEQIKSTLKPYQTTNIIQDAKILEDDVELTRQRTQALVNTLGNLDSMSSEIYEGLKDLIKNVDDQDTVRRVQYYQGLLNYWGKFAKEVRRTLEFNGVKVPLVDRINGTVERSNDIVNDFYFKASKETIWDSLKATAANIELEKNQSIQRLKAKKAPQSEIDKIEKDFEKNKLTKEKVEAALNGSAKDVSLIQSLVEAASYSPDPVYGGLANIIKDNFTELEIRVQKDLNEASMVLKPLVDKAGVNKEKLWELGKTIGQKEKVGQRNTETGEFEEREIWRFMNEFIGADLVRDKYLYDIREAGKKYSETRSDEDKKILASLQSDWEKHRREYFNSEFTEDYYKLWDILRSDEIGQEARLRLNTLYDELGILTGQLYGASADDVLDITDQIEVKRREIGQLSSLYDLVGELKTGEDLEIAMRIKQFNEKSKEVYESKEIPDAFQSAYQFYQQKLLDEGKKKGSFEYENRLTKWLEKNSRIVIKDSFWNKMDEISQAIKNILSELPEQQELSAEIEEAYKVLRDMVRGNRDESGQPVGDELTPERQEKIKKAQEVINEARKKITTVSGLSKIDQNRLDMIFAKVEMGEKLSAEDHATLTELLNKQKELRLGKFQRLALFNLFNELDSLRVKEPTDSYIDTVNNLLKGMNSEALYEILGTLGIDKNNAYLLSNDYVVDQLMNLSDEFEEWFTRNHILKESVNMQENIPKMVWERTYAWNVIKPRDERYYEHTSIEDLQGNKVNIKGMPALKYYKRLIKNEYKTKAIVGVTCDNRGEGYWLPKTMVQGAKDDRYINKEYARFKSAHPDLHNILKALKKIHLKSQEGLDNKDKLYLDFARLRKDIPERLQSDNPFQRVIEKAKTFFQNVKDGWETGFNPNAEMNLVKMDLFDIEGSDNIPVAGLYKLDIEEVSTDVIFTTMRYMLSAERSKQLKKVAPIANMIQKVLNEEKYQPLAQKVINGQTLVYPNKKKDKYVRAKAVGDLIERQILGIQNVGLGADNALAQNFSNFIFKTASSSFLVGNIPSAIKNQMGMKFQGMVEAVGGNNFTWKEFVSSEFEATKTALESITEVYNSGPKSLEQQKIEIFDPERNRFDKHFGESLTRTPKKDWSYLVLGRMNDFRKMSQFQSTLQAFYAMMKHETVPTTDGKTIRYNDAWQVKDGKIQLKDNVLAEWGVSYDKEGNQVLGEKFKQRRLKYQRVIDNMNGAISKEDSPEAERYLIWRYFSFFRRFLPAMIMNRFAKNRYDFQLETTKEGFYLTTAKLLLDTVKNLGRNLPYMTPVQKQAAIKFFVGDVGFIMLLKYLVLGALLGYDDEDENKFKRLKANSDALPLLWVYDDPSREFNFGGWIENHAVLQTLQIAAENDQWIPLPTWGLSQYKDLVNIKSIALGPVVNTAFSLISDMYYIASGDEKSRYQRDVGAWDWNQEGSYKIYTHFAKAAGFNSSTVDPYYTTKNFVNMRNK